MERLQYNTESTCIPFTKIPQFLTEHLSLLLCCYTDIVFTNHLGVGYIYNALLLFAIPQWKLPKKMKFISVKSNLWVHIAISNSNPTQFKAIVFSHSLSSFFHYVSLLLLHWDPLLLRPRTWSSTYTGQVPSSAKKRNLTGMDWGWCNRKRALLDAALTCAGPFLFRSDCIFFWTTFSTSLSSSSQSLKHPYQSPALQREAVRALLEYERFLPLLIRNLISSIFYLLAILKVQVDVWFCLYPLFFLFLKILFFFFRDREWAWTGGARGE